MVLRKFSKEISLVAALFLASMTVQAQQQGGGGAMQQQQQQTAPNPQATPGNGNAAPSMPGGSSSTPSFVDQAFVQDTLQDDQVQVQMSQLAQQKSSSGDVKDFSQHMIQIHNQLDDQFKPLAKQLQVGESQKPSKKEKQEIARLEGLSGTDFDTAYLQAMAKEQQHSLKQFKNEMESQNPMLQKVAKADEPALNQNFQILQKLAQAHNTTLESEK